MSLTLALMTVYFLVMNSKRCSMKYTLFNVPESTKFDEWTKIEQYFFLINEVASDLLILKTEVREKKSQKQNTANTPNKR